MVEAGNVCHDSLLIGPESAYNICAERKGGESEESSVGTSQPLWHAAEGEQALASDWNPNLSWSVTQPNGLFCGFKSFPLSSEFLSLKV